VSEVIWIQEAYYALCIWTYKFNVVRPPLGNPCNTLVGKHEWKWPLGRPRRTRQANIRMYLREI